MIKPVNFPQYYKKFLPELSKAFQGFILSGRYIGGAAVRKFENKVRDYLGAKYVIGCKSGTHALQLALIAAGIKSGDEVITVANTYYATSYAIHSIGAKPVFCDISLETGQIDHRKIEALVTKKTKAILPVHLYGIAVDLPVIKQISKKYKLKLIEDCSHAFGSKTNNEYIGGKSDFACFSLYPTKNLGAFGDAGMIVTKNKKYERKIRELVYLSNEKGNKFHPRAIHAMMDPLQATLLSCVMDNMRQAKKERMVRAGIYRKSLEGYVRMCRIDKSFEVNPYVFPIFVKNRDRLIKHLLDLSTVVQVHYRIDLNRLSQFKQHHAEYLPNTIRHNREQVSLSVHPSVSVKDVYRVCRIIKKYVKNQK